MSLAGRPLAPVHAQIYYRAGLKDPRRVRPHPPGLRVISGNGKAVGPQSLRITSWHCGTSAGSVVHRSAPPLCPPGSLLHLQVNFQDCWDGRRLDSPDHQRPMAYSRRGQCPSTHRVAVPRIGFIVTYPTRGGPGVTLSSGVGRQSAHTAHADFFNAWDQAELARLVRRSINNGPVAKDEAPCPSPRRF